jgi:hypothetical protein
VLDDVVVDGFEGLAQWGEQLFGQTDKEQRSNEGDVARGCFDDGSSAFGGQPDFGCPPVRGSDIALDEAAALHPLGVM